MHGSFRLGDWLVEPDTGRITKNGQTVRVRAKVMDLLVVLARRPGEVVSKDTLLEAVWGTDALSESALTRSMTELRHSLDDDAERPRIIETIPKRGYRVIAPVHSSLTEILRPSPAPGEAEHVVSGGSGESFEAAADDLAPPSTPAVSPRPADRSVIWGLSGLAIGILVASAAMTFIPRQETASDPHVVRYFLQAPEGTTFGAFATEPQPAVSPDGRHIATVATARDATRTIWVHSVDALTATQLIGTDGAWSPFWLPDGRWIAFFAEGKLKRIRLSGGPPETICDAPDGFGGSWSRTGVILFTRNRTSGLHRVSAGGGEPVAVTTLDASREETSHRFPQFLPDGMHLRLPGAQQPS